MRKSSQNLASLRVLKHLSGVVIVLLAGCAPESEKAGAAAAADGRLKVVVSIPPQAYIVDRVGGDHVETMVLVGPGQSPHSYEPTPKQMAALADSRVYFTIGVQFETRLTEKIRGVFRQLNLVDVREGMSLRSMEEGGCEHDHHEETCSHHDHAHGHDHEHGETAHEHDEDASGKDPHVWLSPRMLTIETQNVLKHLEMLDPAHAEDYRENAATLLADLKSLDQTLAAQLAPYKGREFYVFHPAFGYFGDAYGLKQVAVESGGKEPGPRHVAELISRARKDGVRLIFVQKQFSTTSAQVIAEAIGGMVIPLDPLERDCFANLRFIADRIAEGMRPANAPTTQATTSQAA